MLIKSKKFTKWFDKLPLQHRNFIIPHLMKLTNNVSANIKSISNGINELKIQGLCGFRIYWSYQISGDIVILDGSTKKEQLQKIKNIKKMKVIGKFIKTMV